MTGPSGPGPETGPETGPKQRPSALEIEDPAVPKIRRPAPVAPVADTDHSELFRGMLLRVQDAEQAGDLDAALARARDGMSRLEGRPQLAAALADRAADLALLVEMSKQARVLIKPELGLLVPARNVRITVAVE